LSDIPTGWELLHAPLPKASLKALPKSAYGIEGLTDVNEGYLIQRLFASRLEWHWKITSQSYLGHEDRKAQGKDYTTRWYLASVAGELVIDNRVFAGSGAHDNHKLDAAFKGANTVAFKSACKLAGLTVQLYLDGRAIDFIYADDSAEKLRPTREATGEGTEPPATTSAVASSVAPPPSPQEILERTRQSLTKPVAGTCPECGNELRTKTGKYGEFLGCSGYPTCKYIQKAPR
jgi:hypothetical protein